MRVSGNWTVLIYTSASRDLEQAVQDSLHEVAQAGPFSQDTRVVAQVGMQGQFQRLDLSHGELRSLGPPQTGEMSRSRSLSDFIEWGMKEFPSERYVVVLGGHGAGFGGAVTDSQRSTMISTPDLQAGLGAAPKSPEVVVFNTCLMAQAEVAEQLQTTTSNMVATQGQLLGLGLPLAPWIRQLHTFKGGQEAAQELVRGAAACPERSPACSSLDLAKWPQVRERLDRLAQEILGHPQSRADLLACLKGLQHPWPRPHDRPLIDQIDVAEFCRALSERPQLPEPLREAAVAAGDALDSVVTGTSQSQWGGLSIYVPGQPYQQLGPPSQRVGKRYGELAWAEKTHWKEMLDWLTTGNLDKP